jgi:pimeloyl-ACP methyl ester carboxylesterase
MEREISAMRIKAWWIIIGVMCIVFLTAGFFLQNDETIGRFVSPAGEKEFKNAYQTAMKDLPTPTKERWIHSKYGKVKLYRFEYSGSEKKKTPLILLPRKSASTPMWEPNIKDFMKNRTVYTVDLLGEPRLSMETKKIKTPEDQAAWLHEVIKQIPEPNLHVLGLSFGGWSAANPAIHQHDKISSIILVDPVYVFDPIPLKMILASIPASIPILPKSLREKMLSYISGGAEVQNNDPMARLIETGMRTFKSKLPMLKQITEHQLKSLEMPVLGILAEKSTVHHAKESLEIGNKSLINPLSEIVIFKNASHAINGEYPAKLAENIEQFMQQVDKNSR